MKTCKLKINSGTDRNAIVGILARAGYRVSMEERRKGTYIFEGVDFYVIIEDKKEVEE